MDKSIAGKLLAFNKRVVAIKKELENPYFKSSYFDVNAVIEVIRPILNEIGIVVLQPLTSIEGKTAIKTVLVDADTGSEYFEVSPITELAKAQEMGSSITYFRRYHLVSMLLLQGEQDDDGNVASQTKPKADYAPRKIETTTTRTIQNPKNDLPFN